MFCYGYFYACLFAKRYAEMKSQCMQVESLTSNLTILSLPHVLGRQDRPRKSQRTFFSCGFGGRVRQRQGYGRKERASRVQDCTNDRTEGDMRAYAHWQVPKPVVASNDPTCVFSSLRVACLRELYTTRQRSALAPNAVKHFVIAFMLMTKSITSKVGDDWRFWSSHTKIFACSQYYFRATTRLYSEIFFDYCSIPILHLPTFIEHSK